VAKEKINPWEKIKELERDLRTETEKNDKLKKDLDKTSKKLGHATKTVAEIEDQLRNTHKSSAAQKNILKGVVDDLKIEVVTCRKSIKEKGREIKKLQKGRKGFQRRVKTLETQFADASQMLKDPKKLLRESRKECKTLTKELKAAKNKNRPLRLDVKDSRNRATMWQIRYTQVMGMLTGKQASDHFAVPQRFLEDVQTMLKTVIPDSNTNTLLQEINGHITDLLESKRTIQQYKYDKEEKEETEEAVENKSEE